MKEIKENRDDNRDPSPCLGFRFTTLEQIRIRQAARLSKEFMANFGKGRRPYMVDLSRYSNSWYEQAKNSTL